jgi:hypothetical protein
MTTHDKGAWIIRHCPVGTKQQKGKAAIIAPYIFCMFAGRMPSLLLGQVIRTTLLGSFEMRSSPETRYMKLSLMLTGHNQNGPAQYTTSMIVTKRFGIREVGCP